MTLIRLFGASTSGSKDVVRVECQRTFATAAGKVKKGGKGVGANDAPKASSLSKEIKSSTNTLRDGLDPNLIQITQIVYGICLISDQRLVNLERRTLRLSILTRPRTEIQL